MVKIRNARSKDINEEIAKFQEELWGRVKAAFTRPPSKRPKGSSSSHQKSQFSDEGESVPLAILRLLEVVPFVPPSDFGHRDELFSTPWGFSNSDVSTSPALVSPSPTTAPVDVGVPQSSPKSPPWSPSNLMKFFVRPGCPSWSSRFQANPEGMKQKTQPPIETEVRAQSKKQKKKRSASSSDDASRPSTAPGGPNKAESSQSFNDPLPKEKNMKKSRAPVNSNRVTRSKAKSQAKAPGTFKRENEKPFLVRVRMILYFSILI